MFNFFLSFFLSVQVPDAYVNVLKSHTAENKKLRGVLFLLLHWSASTGQKRKQTQDLLKETYIISRIGILMTYRKKLT